MNKQWVFSDFPPSNTVKLESVGPTFSNFRPLLSYPSVDKPVLNNTFLTVTSTVRFSEVRQPLPDLIATPSLDFQVALNLGKTAPLIGKHVYCNDLLKFIRNI